MTRGRKDDEARAKPTSISNCNKSDEIPVTTADESDRGDNSFDCPIFGFVELKKLPNGKLYCAKTVCRENNVNR